MHMRCRAAITINHTAEECAETAAAELYNLVPSSDDYYYIMIFVFTVLAL